MPPSPRRCAVKVKGKTGRHRAPAKWKDSYYVRAYRLAVEGATDGGVAAALGVSRVTFLKWKKRRKALRLALKWARGGLGKSRTQTFSDYVSGRLPDHLREVWDGLEKAEQHANPERRIEALLAGQGEDVRKHIFVHALVAANFNKAEACRRANVGYGTIRKWLADPVFVELMDQVYEMKKDFIEGCLMGLVAQGDTTATIFASKTLNRDRGYDVKKTVEHVGTVSHAHFDFTELPVGLRKQILEWAEQNGKAHALPEHVEDAEVLGVQ
jgi:transposase